MKDTTKERVHIITQTHKRDQRGKAKGRERKVKDLPVNAKVKARVNAEQLPLTVARALGRHRPVETSTVYVNASWTESTYRTNPETTLWADLLQAKRIAPHVRLGSRVTAQPGHHAEIGMCLIVDGMPKVNAQLVASVYSSIAVEQEQYKMKLQRLLLNPILKQKAKPKQKLKPIAGQMFSCFLL